MYMYEMILNILERKGAVPIPQLCQELTESPLYAEDKNKIVHPSTIKSVIKRKNDLFLLEDDLVKIQPNKQVVSLSADVGRGIGSWYKVEVNFVTGSFNFFEWHKQNAKIEERERTSDYGDVNAFKCEVYRSKIWDWEQDYEEKGIVLDGTSWSVKLVTASETYECKGLKSFPYNWRKFCIAVERLTGKPFC